MSPFFEHVRAVASRDQISEAKAFVSELQKIFLEEFYADPSSQGWILIGGANLKFVHHQSRHTKDIDFGSTGNTFKRVHKILESLKFLEHRLEKRIGYSVAIKIDEERTTAKVFVHCQELSGIIGFDVEFTHFKILSTLEKAKIGQVLVLGTSLKEMKVSKILSLLLRPNIEARDLFDLFMNPEPVNPSLLNLYLKKFKKKKSDLQKTVQHIQKNIIAINTKLMEELREDLGIVEAKKYVSNPQDTALVERVLREIQAIYEHP